MSRWHVPGDIFPDPTQMPKVVVPELLEAELSAPHFTEYGDWLFHDYKPMAGGASFSDYVETSVLDHIVDNATFAALDCYLGLWTSALADNSTSATSGELSYS